MSLCTRLSIHQNSKISRTHTAGLLEDTLATAPDGHCVDRHGSRSVQRDLDPCFRRRSLLRRWGYAQAVLRVYHVRWQGVISAGCFGRQMARHSEIEGKPAWRLVPAHRQPRVCGHGEADVVERAVERAVVRGVQRDRAGGIGRGDCHPHLRHARQFWRCFPCVIVRYQDVCVVCVDALCPGSICEAL